ncbi:hypothetical protein XF24_00625 [candidate division SR1 bacterium Aalborg_AAW-1]|nr:hypothetical protein XF24_00625 [candidate division SR1 bacterium Aalborg_AAW-1]
MRKKIISLLLGIWIILLSGLPLVTFAQNDLMDTIFQPSRNLDHVINIGTNKNAVGNEIFRGSTSLSFSDGFTNNAPLLVRITQTLLRLTIALAVPVLIFIGVKLIKSAMNGGKVQDALKEISGVLIGLALALSAMGIIYLIQSIALRSLSGVV